VAVAADYKALYGTQRWRRLSRLLIARAGGRCEVPGCPNPTVVATRHYFAWCLLNVLELPDHVVAAQLRHDEGGTLVRELYRGRWRRPW
jgi:hypothetical protein